MQRETAYQPIVATSERVAWSVDTVLANHRFNVFLPFVPDSWLGLDEIDFLHPDDLKFLNHMRAFSYIHMLGNYEDLIVRHVTDVASSLDFSNPAQMRALFRFCDEEMKHQELFERAEELMETCCSVRFGRYFDEGKQRLKFLAERLMAYPPLVG